MSESMCLPRMLLAAIGVIGLMGQIHADSRGQLLDPTRPQGWQVSGQAQAQPAERPVEALRLQGTFSLAGKRSAMISGQRVTVGDEVSGAQVIEINRDKVILRIAGETVELASLLPDVKSAVVRKGDGK